MVFKNFLHTLIMLFSVVLILPGCMHYHVAPLSCLVNSGTVSQGDVSLSYSVYSKKDSKRFLGRDILRKGFQPVHITLVNNSDRTYSVVLSNLSLPTVPPEHAAQVVHRMKECYLTGGLIGGCISAEVICVSCPLVVGWIAGFLLAGLGVIGRAYASRYNRTLDDEFYRKVFPEDVLLVPHGVVNGVAFVPRESFKLPFTFALRESKSGKIAVLNSSDDSAYTTSSLVNDMSK